MDIFVAGGTGTIALPLVRALVASGHRVTTLTRSPVKVDAVRASGAVPAVVDALDPEAMRRVLCEAHPTVGAVRVVRNPDKLRYIEKQLSRTEAM
jgi:nucleoside-diphosphate-sugar epimerase